MEPTIAVSREVYRAQQLAREEVKKYSDSPEGEFKHFDSADALTLFDKCNRTWNEYFATQDTVLIRLYDSVRYAAAMHPSKERVVEMLQLADILWEGQIRDAHLIGCSILLYLKPAAVSTKLKIDETTKRILLEFDKTRLPYSPKDSWSIEAELAQQGSEQLQNLLLATTIRRLRDKYNAPDNYYVNHCYGEKILIDSLKANSLKRSDNLVAKANAEYEKFAMLEFQ